MLATITWLVFGQTLGHEFINYDDYAYVVDNGEVTKGLTPHGIGWAFTHSVSYNWHPLTIISHMVDCQLHGLKAGWHHATNVVLHMLAVVLLFLVLREMTGGPSSSAVRLNESVRSADQTGNNWRSAFVAALFAIHPLHVESVAWVAERKDVLSGVFFMLTLAVYVRYVRKRSLANYLLVILTFALGLMSKPMLVTVPFVLLLLDYWPLGRVQRSEVGGEERSKRPTPNAQRSTSNEEQRTEDSSPRRSPAAAGRRREVSGQQLILEKIPFLLLSAASCVVTLNLQRQSMRSIASLPVWVRIYEASVSSVAYVYQMLWPARLAVLYPYPRGALSVWPFALAITLLVAATVVSFRLRRQYPYLLVGWLWYLGMLVPVLGIIQVGPQARADRYTYLPHIGLYLAVTWAIADLSASWRHRREILSIGAAATIVGLAWCAWVQTSYWENGESLWRHTLAVTRNNAVAHNDLGDALDRKGGPMSEAILHFRKAVELSPDYADAQYNLGTALFREGRLDEAIACWQKAISIRRDDADAHANLGHALVQKRRPGEAVAHFEKALEIAPQSPETLNNFAWLLSTCSEAQLRNGSRAIQLAQQAEQLSAGKNPVFVRTLAAAYAESGRFKDATDTARRASELAVARGDSVLASELRMDIDLYQMNFPVREQRIHKATP